MSQLNQRAPQKSVVYLREQKAELAHIFRNIERSLPVVTKPSQAALGPFSPDPLVAMMELYKQLSGQRTIGDELI